VNQITIDTGEPSPCDTMCYHVLQMSWDW